MLSSSTRRCSRIAVVLLVVLAALHGASLGVGAEQLVGENAIGQTPPDFTLVGSDGKPFSVRGYAAGRPLVISYVYTSCTYTCPPILKSLKRAFEEKEAPGQRFAAITVSFDPENDTPKVLAAFSKDFGGGESWRFATADEKTIKEFSGSHGFYFEKSGDGFNHVNMISAVDSGGRIVRQLYGVDFAPGDIIGAVNDAELGVMRKGGEVGVMDRIKLFCFRYDDVAKKMKPDYGAITALVGVMLLQALTITFLIRYIFFSKKA